MLRSSYLSARNTEWKEKLDELVDDFVDDFEITGTTSRTFRVDTDYADDLGDREYIYEVTFKLLETTK
jgi:hypothetical protein